MGIEADIQEIIERVKRLEQLHEKPCPQRDLVSDRYEEYTVCTACGNRVKLNYHWDGKTYEGKKAQEHYPDGCSVDWRAD